MYKGKRILQKIVPMMLAVTITAGAISGCAVMESEKKEIGGVTVNGDYDDEMKPLWTVSGGKVMCENEMRIVFGNVGTGVISPAEWVSNGDNMIYMESIRGYDISLVLSTRAKTPYIRFLCEKNKKDIEEIKKENQEYQKIDKIVSYKGNTYYIAYNETLNREANPGSTEEDEVFYKKMADVIPRLKKDIIIVPPVKMNLEKVVDEKLLAKMKIKDTNGNVVTSEIFRNYDITAVNIWTTWCGPCVEEMPELAKLYKDLPANANFISVCMDGEEEQEKARKILEKSNAEFVTLLGDERLREGAFGDVIAFPTTVFINREGKMVGDPFMSPGNKSTYRALIEEKLNIGK